MAFTVPVISPNVDDGVGLDPFPQLALGEASSTWLNALNISVRNSSVCIS